jgi:ATP-dependent RNA helicase DDX10/DBP4
MEEIALLSKRILNELPPTGKYSTLTELAPDMDESKLELWEKPYLKFKDLPISTKTLQGLNSSKYFNLTPIQRCTLPHSLGGRDILGASKTGSGKTLCFLIPILENLYRDGFIKDEGLGALILLPTRELAIQVFEVINKIGKHHNYSVGLVIGGNDYEKEKYVVNNMNILIGTPGRILQHMAESYMFTADNLKILVIDEADRILDEGFEDELIKIINYLPKNRQTLLFSATLTRNLKRLVKIHMRSPEYINISNTDNVLNSIENINKNELSIMKIKNDDNNNANTNNKNILNNTTNLNDMIIPKNLNQYYTIVEPEERVNVLYSFLKTHKMSKILVFVSSRKQVRYFTEVFKHLKLGMLFLDIHGKQKQGKRYSTFYTFSQKRNSVVLFATDLASRGVDFPAIDWVIQLDPPEDISQYIHRVGRTARYKSDGNSVLFIGQKEMNFVNELELRKIKVTKIKIGANKINNITPVVRSLLSEHTELIEIAEKAISSYVKSINLMANKNVFNIKNIDLGKLALSYGLVSSPEMVVKSKKEVEEEIEEEDNKIIDKKNKKMEEEKNLVKENLINTNTENKKKSKLFKLKEKIKLKKLMKQKEKEAEENQKEKPKEININEDIEEKSENSDDAFLSVKKDKKKEKIEKTEKIDIKLGQKRKKSKSVEESEDDSEENEFYKKVKNRLEKNKEIDKQKEKERISIKHKEDKIKLKEKDYQKHGIEIEEDMPTNKYKIENDESDNENMEESLEEKSEENNNYKNNKENKVKININHSTLKQKENAALEILKKKGIL